MKIAASFLFTALAVLPASAQVGSWPPLVPSGTAYVGPLDAIATQPIAWWALRKYKASYSGHLINACTAGDASCADVDGNVDGTLNQSMLPGSGPWTIKEWYDQTGGGYNEIQATEADRATLTINALGHLVMGTGNGTTTVYDVSISSNSAPISFEGAFERTGAFTTLGVYIASANAPVTSLASSNTANTARQGVSGSSPITATASDSAFHYLGAVYNSGGTTGDLYVDGTQTPGSLTVTGQFNQVALFATGSGSNECTCQVHEAGAFTSALSSSDQTTLSNNWNTYVAAHP